MDYNSGYSRKMHARCFLMVYALIIHGVAFAQLVVDTIGSNLVSDHTGGYLGTGVSFADFNGDGIDDLSLDITVAHCHFMPAMATGSIPLIWDWNCPLRKPRAFCGPIITMATKIYLSLTGLPNKLWLNDGEMGFEDVSSSCGIAQDNRRSYGPAFGDFDRDGLLDLFVANYGYAVDVPQGNELYRNLGGGQFEDVTAEFGLDGENLQSFQATWMDDRDGWLDLCDSGSPDFSQPFYNKAQEQGAVGFEGEACGAWTPCSTACPPAHMITTETVTSTFS